MTGFSIFVPAGWQLVDLRKPLDEQLERAVDSMASGLPLELLPRVRAQLWEHHRSLLEGLAGAGCLAYLMPVDPLRERLASPALVIRPYGSPDGTPPLDLLLADAATTEGASLLEIDHLVALRVARRDHVETSAPDVADVVAAIATEGDAADLSRRAREQPMRVAHRVRYVLGLPGDDASWVEILASVLVSPGPEDEEIAPAVIDLCDELAKSFRWLEKSDD